MNRFDIPLVVTNMINKAIEIELIDASDVLALGATHGDNLDGVVNEIVEYAYCNIHVNKDHAIMVPFSDAYYQLKQSSLRMTKTEEVDTREPEEMTFDEQFEIFFQGCITINHDYMAKSFPNNPKDEFSFKIGKKYAKVIRDGSVHCFVNIENGDVLKAASWKAPAKHARGNIFDDKNGLGSMQEFGPAYLR